MGQVGGHELRSWPHGRSSIDHQVSAGPETKIWPLRGFFEELPFQLISPVTAEAPPGEVCGPGRWRTYEPNQVAGQPPWALGAIARPVGGTGGGDTGPPRCPSEAWSGGWPLVRRRGYPDVGHARAASSPPMGMGAGYWELGGPTTDFCHFFFPFQRSKKLPSGWEGKQEKLIRRRCCGTLIVHSKTQA